MTNNLGISSPVRENLFRLVGREMDKRGLLWNYRRIFIMLVALCDYRYKRLCWWLYGKGNGQKRVSLESPIFMLVALSAYR